MLKSRVVRLEEVFGALAHPIRLAIVERLAEGDCTVGDLAAPHDVSAPAISQHLRVLEEAGLLVQTPDGRVRRCALDAAPLSTAFSWLVRYRVFWEDVLDDVESRLQAELSAERTASEGRGARRATQPKPAARAKPKHRRRK